MRSYSIFKSLLVLSLFASISSYAGTCDNNMLSTEEPGIQVYAQEVVSTHRNSRGEIMIVSKSNHAQNIGLRPGSRPIEYISVKIGMHIRDDERISVIGEQGMNETRNLIRELNGNRELQHEVAHDRFGKIMRSVLSDTITLVQARTGNPVYQPIQMQRPRFLTDAQGNKMLFLEEVKHTDQITDEQLKEIIRVFEAR